MKTYPHLLGWDPPLFFSLLRRVHRIAARVQHWIPDKKVLLVQDLFLAIGCGVDSAVMESVAVRADSFIA